MNSNVKININQVYALHSERDREREIFNSSVIQLIKIHSLHYIPQLRTNKSYNCLAIK